MLMVALSLASATSSRGFPSEHWGSGNNPPGQGERGKHYNPIVAPITWVLPEALWHSSTYDGKAIALVFSGVAVNPNDPAPEVVAVFDSSGHVGLASDGSYKPALMDVALLSDAYFNPVTHSRTGISAVEFCVFPQTGNGGQPRPIYADLLPSFQNTGIWDYYPAPRYDPGILPDNHPTKKHNEDIEFIAGYLPGTQQITDFPIYFWFTVLVFDEDTVDGSSTFVAYDMLFQFAADAGTGNSLTNIRLEFRNFYNIEDIIPEPATSLLALAGIGLLPAQRRKGKE